MRGVPSLRWGVLVCAFMLLVGVAGVAEAGTETITIDVGRVRATTPSLGLNLNYLLDGGRPVSEIAQLAPGVLRYPGGEKSDTYAWSVPPYLTPQPALLRTGPQEWPAGDGTLVNPDGSFIRPPMDFDHYLALCAAVGATPIVVVPFDSAFAPARPPGTAPTLDQIEALAVAWVRYAAGRVPYWEIGNESYLGGWNGSPTVGEYAAGVERIGSAMKLVDPSIQIGVNGSDPAWWTTVLDRAPVADFLAVHSYPVWGWTSYSAYRSDSRTLIYDVERAAAVLDARGDTRRWIAVTEFGALTWTAWPAINDMGHAVLLSDMLGQLLAQPRVRLHLLWTTRWQAWNWPASDTLPAAIGEGGTLAPSGQVVALWGSALGDQVVYATSSSKVRAGASYRTTTGDLAIVLTNKDTSPRTVAVVVRGYAPATSIVSRMQLAGTGASDPAPQRSSLPSLSIGRGQLRITLPPVSVTVLRLTGQRG